MADHAKLQELPEGIISLLDTDLYKLTMQCAVLKYLPDVQVAYKFTNRTPNMRLSRAAYNWLEGQIERLDSLALSPDELRYLQTTCTFLSDAYLRFLTSFRLQPSKQVKASFLPLEDTGSSDDLGDLHLDVEGLWLDTILYEIPLLALTSEAYFRFCDKNWTHDGQEQKAYDKGISLIERGCVFSDFGTRRRRDCRTHDLVMQGLTRAAAVGKEKGFDGRLSATSNVYFSMRYGIPVVGTVAHEWYMGIASITDDYVHANETALRYWVGCFGEGVLGIALTDTFGTPAFLKAFQKSLPTKFEAERNTASTQLPGRPRPAFSQANGVIDLEKESDALEVDGSVDEEKPRTYAQSFAGVRQDSGNPLEFVNMMRDFYDSQGITDRKTIVFSDSLNLERCFEYKTAAERSGFVPTFGIGTFLTNDFTHTSNGHKSAPLNIVIKLSSASGRPAIKLSDNIGKNTGDSETVHKVKEELGYVEKKWVDGDERSRWGKTEAGD